MLKVDTNKIRTIMKQKRMSQAALANEINVTRTTLNQWLTGNRGSMSAQGFFAIIDALGCDISDVVSCEDK